MLTFFAFGKPHRALNIIVAVFISLLAGGVHAAANNMPEIKTLLELALEKVVEHNLPWYEELPPAHQKVVAATVVAREKQAQGELEQIDIKPFSMSETRQQLRNEDRMAQVRNLRCLRTREVGPLESELVNQAPVLMSLSMYACVACVINQYDVCPEDDVPFYMCTGLCIGAWTFVSQKYTRYCVRLFADRLSSDGRWRINLQRAQALMQDNAPRPMRMDVQAHEKLD